MKVLISGTFSPIEKEQIFFAILREYVHVFAWSYKAMPGIDPSVITHRLNVDPNYKAVKQKKSWSYSGRLSGKQRNPIHKFDRGKIALVKQASFKE